MTSSKRNWGNIDWSDLDWRCLDNPYLTDYVNYVVKSYSKEIEDYLEDLYGGEDQIDFQEFWEWIRYEPADFISEFPQYWATILKKCKDFTAEDVVSISRWEGEEEDLLRYAYDANEKFGDEVKKLLIEEGRWNEEDELEESYYVRRPRASRKPNKFLESRRISRKRR